MFRKILWFLSGFCTILLFVPDLAYAWVILLIGSAILLWVSYTDTSGRRLGFAHRWVPNLLGLLFLAGSGLIFYYRWHRILIPQACQVASWGLTIISSYFVLTTVANIFARSWQNSLPLSNLQKMSLRSRIFIMLCTVALLAICSACSFLYPVNPEVSANTLMTGARSMLAGMTPYVSIYTQDGPVPYLLNALSWVLFQDYTGIFILEVVLDGLFLLYLMKMVGLFFDINQLLMTFPIVALCVFASHTFCNGDTTEEFCLFFLSISFYLGLRELMANRLPGYSHFLIIGLCCGFVLWIQYQVLGFYIGWILLPIFTMLLKRRWKKLFWSLVVLALGVALASSPIYFYFYATHTLRAMVQAYFLDPIVISSYEGNAVLGVLLHMGSGLLQGILANPMIFLELMLSFACALRMRRRLFWLIVFCFAGMVIGQYGFFEVDASSALLWNVFGGFAIVLYYQLFESLDLTYFRQITIRIWVLMICLIGGYYLSGAYRLADHKRDEFPQVIVADIIDQVEDPTLLCYKMEDRGFYTYANILPHYKYYAGNFPSGSKAENEQYEVLVKGSSDFVLSSERISPNITNQGKYVLIKTIAASATPDQQNYFLYVRNGLLKKLVY